MTAPTLQTLEPYLLAPTLMLGPLVANYLDGDLPLQGPSSGGLMDRIKKTWNSWTLVDTRNFIVVGRFEVYQSCSADHSLM